MQCPACSAEVPDDDLFCEICGHSLKAAAPAGGGGCSCGAGPEETDEDGFCTRCGKRVVRPAADHVEEVISPECAGVSDRGLRHDRNEDRFGVVQVGDGFALVVCDGVSTTRTSEVASEAVTTGVLQALAEALRGGAVEDSEGAMRAAIAAGAAALAQASPRDGSGDAPSTTVVAALVVGGQATVGWAGDSRAYWLNPPEILALTEDHSWVNEMVKSGRMAAEDAEKAPEAHAITRWIGADADAEFAPEVMRFPLRRPGMLLLCTDGLWNYAPTAGEMAALVAASGAGGTEALEVVRRLVLFANGRGGHDNITAVLLRLEPAANLNVSTEEAR